MGDFVEIGEVVKPQGLRGRMKALSYLESEDILQGLDEVFIRKAGQAAASFRVRKIQKKKNVFFLELDDIRDMDAALNLVGSRILVSSDRLKKLSAGEYYWRDLIGLRVVTEAGEVLGRVESIFPTGSNDVYVCKGRHREILLPAIGDVIREIDLEKGVMVIRLLEGL
jgi:16S rRNA processing protein RimM